MNLARLPRLAFMLFILAAPLLTALPARSQSPRFSHQTIFVTDLNRAGDFYEKVLQLKKIAEPFHDGKHIWFQISEHGQLHVVSGAKEDIPHDINIHLAFSVASMDAFTKHLDWTRSMPNTATGAQNTTTPQLRPDGIKQVYFQDPDGYWIEVERRQVLIGWRSSHL